MTRYELGEILLLKAFPFSDLGHVKKRPALVLADTGDSDIVVCRITSESPRDSSDLELSAWKAYGLLLPSTVRVSKIASLDKRLIAKKMGILGSPDRRKARSCLKNLFGIHS